MPLKGVVVLLILCGIGAYFLVPNEEKVIERLYEDELDHRALIRLTNMTSDARSARPAFYRLMECRIRSRQLTRGQTLPQVEILHLLRIAVEGYVADPENQEFIKLYGQFLDHLKPFENFALAQLEFVTSQEEEIRRPLVDQLVRVCLSEDKPSMATDFFLTYIDKGAPDSSDMIELIRLSRLSGKQHETLPRVQEWLDRYHSIDEAENHRVALLKFEVLRELNQPEEAFELLLDIIQNLPESQRTQRLDQLIETALQSDRTEDAVPYILQEAMQDRDNPVKWEKVAVITTQGGLLIEAVHAREQILKLQPDNKDNRLQLAQLYLWTEHPDKAFDQYLTLFGPDHPEILDPLIELNKGLYRDEELLEVMQAHRSVVMTSGHGIDLARLLLNVGRFEEAKPEYRRLIEEHPDDVDLMTEYGSLLLALFQDEEARDIFEKAQSIQPLNTSVLKSMGQISLNQGEYLKALAVFDKLSKSIDDPEVLNTMISLAGALGKNKVLIEALTRKIERTDSATPSDYQNLSYLHLREGQMREALTTYERGLEAFPADPPLRAQYAYALADSGQFQKAWSILSLHPDLKSDREMIQFGITLLLNSERYNEARQFVVTQLTTEIKKLPFYTEIQGRIAEAEGDNARALQHYRTLYDLDPRNISFLTQYARLLSLNDDPRKALKILKPVLDTRDPGLLKILAQVFAASRLYKEAEIYQRKYIQSEPPDLAQAWGGLGDILLSVGNTVHAKRAYQRGLDILIDDIAMTSTK